MASIRKTYLTDTGVAGYSAVCLIATGVLFLTLHQLGLRSVGLFPVLVALMGIATRWSLAPLVLMGTLAICLSAPSNLGGNRWLVSSPAAGLRLPDLVLCAAVLAYFIAFYRLQSVWKHAFPPRRPLKGAVKETPQRRPAGLIDSREIGWALLALPVWAGIAQVIWAIMPKESALSGLLPIAWQAVASVCTLAFLSVTIAAVLDYLRRRHMSADEAQLYLQDLVWNETRREQRLYSRWIAWEHGGRASYLIPALLVVATFLALALVVILFSF